MRTIVSSGKAASVKWSAVRFAVLGFVFFAAAAGAQEHSGKQRHWELTEDETLWVGRYSNCRYGYFFIILPAGVIAHAEHPPSPHRGFLISLPDVGLRTYVSVDDSKRSIGNVTEESTLAGMSDYQVDLGRSRTSSSWSRPRTHCGVSLLPGLRPGTIRRTERLWRRKSSPCGRASSTSWA